MVYDNEGDKNIEEWSRLNNDFLPEDAKEYFEENRDVLHVMFDVYPKIKRHITPALRKLLYKQYPNLRTETRPMVVEFIEGILFITATVKYLMQMYHLVHGHNTGRNVREEYTELDDWVDFYCRPAKPQVVDESKRYKFWWITNKEWKAEIEEENRELLKNFNREERRKAEFVNLVQKIYFKYYPELLDLNNDEWILYAVLIREEYELFKELAEDVELFIDCEFPEEDIKLSDEDYWKKYSTWPQELKDKGSKLREERFENENI